jgi:integrase
MPSAIPRGESLATVADVQKALTAAVAAGLQFGGDRPFGERRSVSPTLAKLVPEWRTFLVHVDHDGEPHAAAVARMVERVAKESGAVRPADLDERRVGRWFASLDKAAGRGGHKGLSANTRNHYLAALKTFLNWCRKRGHAAFNPLQDFKRWNADADRRHTRRAMTGDEVGRLIAAAAAGPSIETIPGPDRAILYAVACWTGLRKSELGSLTPANFVDLGGESPTVNVDARFTKNKKPASVPLHPAVASMVAEWLAGRTRDQAALLWPISKRSGGKTRKTHKMIRRDLEAAGLDYRNAAGVADFHAARHTFITSLGRARIGGACVDVGVRQRLARHSDVKLTLGVYTHVVDDERRDAVRALAPPLIPQPLGTFDGSKPTRRRRRDKR